MGNMRGVGESSSAGRASAMMDSDAQLARRLQKHLDEETLDDVTPYHYMEQPPSRRYDKHAGAETHGSTKGKGKAKGNDFAQGDERSSKIMPGNRGYGHWEEDHTRSASQKRGKFEVCLLKRSTLLTLFVLAYSGSNGQYPQDIEENLEILRDFYGRVSGTKCRKCASPLGTDLQIKTVIGKWAEAAKVKAGKPCTVSICAVTCGNPKCGANTCLGCGEKPRIGSNARQLEGLTLDWCCDHGRLFAIWLFLARYDQVELQMQTKQAERLAQAQRKAERPRETPGKGVGYAEYDIDNQRELLQSVYSFQQTPGGMTFAGSGPLMNDFRSADEKTDDLLRQILAFLCVLLPAVSAKDRSKFDKNPPKALMAMLQLSILLDKLAELLRNDSIDDLTKRSGLYFASFQFAEALGSHPATLRLVAGERYSKQRSSGLQALSERDEKRNEFGKARETMKGDQLLAIGEQKEALTPAIITRFQNLYKQSQIVLAQGKHARDAFSGQSGQVALDLCERIVVTYVKISSMVKDEPEKSTEKNSWAKYHSDNALEQTDKVLETFAYGDALRQLESVRSPPLGRMQYLIKEIATLATSLPDGIFVKSSLSTPGALKCLILGPEDTPYAGGLFEFDVFAGARFPTEPPNVYFCTTGGGVVDFNPNLYPDGKVCLSLLNTFDGRAEERWQPKKSTIISVLVSIQSMILCSEPWRNEPGNSDAYDRYALRTCQEYSTHRQCFTVRYAMINWLTAVRKRKGLWDDIIRQHFKVHGDEILKTVRGWSRKNPGIRSFRQQKGGYAAVNTYQPGGADLLAELESLMDKVR